MKELKKRDEARKESENKLKSALESIKTPAEKLAEDEAQYKKWLASGNVTVDQFTKLMDKARREAQIDIRPMRPRWNLVLLRHTRCWHR